MATHGHHFRGEANGHLADLFVRPGELPFTDQMSISLCARQMHGCASRLEFKRYARSPRQGDVLLPRASRIRFTGKRVSQSTAISSRAAVAGARNSEAYVLDIEDVLTFERTGHVAVRGLFEADELQRLGEGVRIALLAEESTALRQNARVLLGSENMVDDFGLPLDDEDLEELMCSNGAAVPFLQVFNLWRKDCQPAHDFCFSPKLLSVVAQLLGCAPERVRLYQDATFCKRSRDAPTRWHADLHMAPLDANRLVTVWAPLQSVPRGEDGGTGLVYADASHRDVALQFWDLDVSDLEYRYEFTDHGAFELGDVAIHHGWCLHSAPAGSEYMEDSDGVAVEAADQDYGSDDDKDDEVDEEEFEQSDLGRLAFTASFFVDGTSILPDLSLLHDEDQESYQEWVLDVGTGNLAQHACLPLCVDQLNQT